MIMELKQTIHYCKAKKLSGKPIIVKDITNNIEIDVSKWFLDLFDKNGDPVRIEVEFNNATPRAKRQGATTMLKVFR